MQYAIHHVTHFTYAAPIAESLMEVRACPRTDGQQQCYSFDLTLTPHAQLFSYHDFMGNIIHHFDIPTKHQELILESRSLVEVREHAEMPESLPPSAWDELDAVMSGGEHLEMTLPSAYARPTEELARLAREFEIVRRDDPLSILREMNRIVYEAFDYDPRSTHVRSPIDDALRSRAGVCQDFAHIFVSLARGLGIPCRYVSGYLFHRTAEHGGGDRSAEDGSHAWAEAFLPEIGWLGFDPTNNIMAEERHIRVALGRDYADVPPTRGIYKGSGRSTLRVGVRVALASFQPREDPMPSMAQVGQEDAPEAEEGEAGQQQ